MKTLEARVIGDPPNSVLNMDCSLLEKESSLAGSSNGRLVDPIAKIWRCFFPEAGYGRTDFDSCLDILQ